MLLHKLLFWRHFKGLDSIIYRGVLISGNWNREVPLYTEVSSFRGLHISGGWNRI